MLGENMYMNMLTKIAWYIYFLFGYSTGIFVPLVVIQTWQKQTFILVTLLAGFAMRGSSNTSEVKLNKILIWHTYVNA
jgi:hypothetical protein